MHTHTFEERNNLMDWLMAAERSPIINSPK